MAFTKTRGGQIHGHTSVESGCDLQQQRTAVAFNFIDCRLEASVIQFFERAKDPRTALLMLRHESPINCLSALISLRAEFIEAENNVKRDGKERMHQL